ncbi:hypothetical protein [Salmonella enterica]|uniref:hypothetical protein n=1 Tax=Salmonella enterica TaxID=28901 RepID=UPI003D31B028|nr:hypothetical protein [Salmonella enterica]
MKIEFKDRGKYGCVIITSTVFEFRRHKRTVDAFLGMKPEAFCIRSGFFILKTEIYDSAADFYQGYREALKEMKL